MNKSIKITLALTLQLGLIASIGNFVGWPYMNYVLYLTIFFFLLTLLLIIIRFSKD